jgi:hypothetical protein
MPKRKRPPPTLTLPPERLDTTMVSVRMPVDLLERADRLAKSRRVPRSELLIWALGQLVDGPGETWSSQARNPWTGKRPRKRPSR